MQRMINAESSRNAVLKIAMGFFKSSFLSNSHTIKPEGNRIIFARVLILSFFFNPTLSRSTTCMSQINVRDTRACRAVLNDF